MKHPFLSSLRDRLSFAAIAIATAGCQINYADGFDAALPSNACTTDADCGANATCVNHTSCVGTNADLTDLILEVRPSSGASYGASTSFLIPVNTTLASPKDTAFNVLDDFTLPEPVAIKSGMVHLGYTSSTCVLGAEQSVPATITFDRVADLAGFRFDSYTVTSAQAKGGKASPYEFDASLLPGKYSVYIQPLPAPGCLDDPPPPVFYPSQDITATSITEANGVDWRVIKPTTLSGDIQSPDGGDLTGWTLDLVEPTRGRVISTQQTLKQGMVAFAVNVKLSFVWNDVNVSPYIRLRPPVGQARPSVYWGLIESLGSQSKTEVHLSVANLQIDPRDVELRVLPKVPQVDANNVNKTGGVVSSLQIQSVKLSGDVEKNAAYSIDVPHTELDGSIKLKLPPGTYQVRATPIGSTSLAAGDINLVVPPLDPKVPGNPCFCGHVIELAEKASVTGTVLTPMGAPLVGASIAMRPSQADAVNYWKRVVHAVDPRPLAPRSEVASTDDGGSFSFNVDPGLSDLTVRPSDDSGFPWLVRPRVQVAVDTGVQFPDLSLPSPAVLRGTVMNPGTKGPAAHVSVDGWLPVKNADGSPPTTVIQIGSTTTDENGHYVLILPASISQ